MITLTVVMPVYNGEKYLQEAIDSVLAQTFEDFELLVIDDASKDHSVEIIQSYTDPRIRLVRNPVNSGVAHVRNLGLQEAKGEFLAWMDCDDLIDPKKFQIQIDFLRKKPKVGICGTWLTRFGEGRSILSKSPTDPGLIKATLIFYPSVWNATAMFRMEFIRKAQLQYDTRLAVAEDYNFYFDASFHFPIENISESLYFYRASETSIMKKFEDQEKKMFTFYKIIYSKVFEKLGIEKSEENFLIHRKIGSTVLLNNWPEYKKAFNWLMFLKSQNKKVGVYDSKSFDPAIDNVFYFLSKRSSQIGLKVFIFFIKNKTTFSYLEFNLLLRLFIRCLIKYNKF